MLRAKRLLPSLTLLALLGMSGPATAATIAISTATSIGSQPSYTFGEWIFELVNPSNLSFNLLDEAFVPTPGIDFIVAAECCAGDFTLRRLNDAPFTLEGLFAARIGATVVGGVNVPGTGSLNFQPFNFAGEPGVTNVTSVLFSLAPDGGIQLASFDATVPEPATLLLFGSGLAAVAVRRRLKAHPYRRGCKDSSQF